jgi:hypothetical protein
MSMDFAFRPKARLLLQLGDQLIKNESVALLELVKNSYDADAKKVLVSMTKLADPQKARIIIEDDGDGMDVEIIEKVWMEPGSNYKEKIFLSKKKSKLNRLPIGEKGIGRFGVHKLGNKIEIVTKMKGKKEVVFNIDWNDFSNAEYLGDVKIQVLEREPLVFPGDSKGTRICITDLKNKWTKGTVRNLYRAINSLCSPFESIESFEVDFVIDQEDWIKGLININEIKNYALYEADIVINGNKITKFNYYFRPWEVMTKLIFRQFSPKEEFRLLRVVGKSKKTEEFNLNQFNIGEIKIKIYIFDRDSKTLDLAISDKKGYKEYLDDNGGIRVYRDKMRIFDYGEPENDWLGLDYGRFNAPGTKISNNLVICSIELDREQSYGLIEKTNREGFIENEAYQVFKEAVHFAIQKVEQQRRIDKDKIRTYYSPTSKSEPVIANLNLLQETINKSVKDIELKKELSTHVKRIEDDYKHITEVYIKSAGAGLSLSIAIHEMEKIIYELVKATDFDKASLRISELVLRLSQLVEGYSTLFKGRDKKIQPIQKIIQSALFNVEYRLSVHGIEIIDGFTKYTGKSMVNCTKNLIISVIVNIIDNSIWWAEYSHISNKKIYLGITNEIPGFTTIVIADNGGGFSLPTEDIIKPFITDRPEGMGLGLYLASEIMKGHNGSLIFPEFHDISLPDEFHSGAIVGLAFKEEKN